MKVEPSKEHQWLQQLAGEWTMTGEAVMEPGKPPEKWAGTESVRSLGGLWILADGQGDMPGGGIAISQMTLGYDPKQERFIGTFVASVMTHLWVYENGTLDAARKVLTLNTEGPDFKLEKMAKYRDVIEVLGDEERSLSSFALGEDGAWRQFMKAVYRRRR
jgi:hypothetical protein